MCQAAQNPSPGDEFGPLERFGQGEGRCTIACCRYIRWWYEKQILEENDLIPTVFKDDERGHCLTDLAGHFLGVGYQVELRCEADFSGRLGELPPSAALIVQGNRKTLQDWLAQTVHGGMPVIVGVHTRFFQQGGYPKGWGGRHVVVVLKVEENTIAFLEPDPPDQEEYPKQGRRMLMGKAPFMKAWQTFGCCALRVWK